MAVSYDIPLHDIKPLMDVPDSSLTLFIVLVVIVTVLFAGGLYLLYRFIKNRKIVNKRKTHYNALIRVDLTEPKKAAYSITEHGRAFADDSPRLKEAYANLVSRLEIYKYKKVVSPIDEESRSYYEIYLGMIDV